MEFLSIVSKLAAVLVFISVSVSGKSVPRPKSELTLTVLHNNDMHGRFMETSRDSLACSEADAKGGKCYGGYARLFTKVNEIRKTHPNVILLSGGDYDRGTLWHTVYKWRAFTHFSNQFNYTALALGNHDFDEAVEGVVSLVEGLTSPVLVSNIIDSKEPSLQGKYKKSLVIEMEGRKIGIIGYISYKTSEKSHTGRLGFKHEEESIGDEAKRLHDSGVDIIIALGHSGYKEDLRIAKVPYVDLVVGAHSHTFLYNGIGPDIEIPQGSYPTIVAQEGGKKVLVVQAYAFTKYLGYLQITFDENGEVVDWNGNPILLDASVPQDPGMLADLQVWNEELQEYSAIEVGQTKVFLDGSCQAGECNLGSFFADAMIHAYNSHARRQRGAIPSKADVHVALLNSGNLRASLGIASKNGELSSITLADLMTLLPFRNSIRLIDIEGKYLRAALEHSVGGTSDVDFGHDGKFLQVSGLRILFNMSAPYGHRAQHVKVRGEGETYSVLQDTTVYRILANEFIAQGGDGFDMLNENAISNSETGLKEMEMLLDYIKYRSPITQTNDGRIVVITDPKKHPPKVVHDPTHKYELN